MASKGSTTDSKTHVSRSQQEGKYGKGEISQIDYTEKGEKKTFFEYKLPIYFDHGVGEQPELIGYCYIYANQTLIFERVQYGFIIIIVNSLIKTVALWFIFLFFTRRIIAMPLSALTQATKQLDPSDQKSFRHCDKLDKIFYSGNDDEIYHLTNSFLKMRDAVIEKFDEIEQQNATLEERVKERTSTIEEVNKELKHLSLHDPLTGLPNRNLFHDRLEHLLLMAKRDNFCFAVASMDLRKFKEINDTFGHLAGDAVLKELSKRMQGAIRSVDTVARMGGDEFALLVQGVNAEAVDIVGKKIVACTYQPIIFEQQSIIAGVNIGFSIYPDHANNADALYKSADIAMYTAKKNEKGIAVFTPIVNQELERREIISQGLNDAIEKEQFQLYYQPIICGKTYKVHGLEALIRWEHPKLGFIPSGEFIPIAERSNIIKLLTDWVLHQALLDSKQFEQSGYNLSISVNISGRLISDSTFNVNFQKIIQQYQFPNEKIKLEITESSMMKNPQQALKTLEQLKTLGVSISIDDFGTGYSSFSYLARLPVDELKIDRTFLKDFNKNGRVVIQAITDLAHRLELEVVAEGVENKEVLQRIQEFGCDYWQGYHFSRPIPLTQLLQWLAEFETRSEQ
ncbi:hypothetical protein AB835_10980 [Candidatus Endobugula sertula]|uniref:Diguanylate cyclase n=1 Tax=Candidatus Endobugula sertula TaxID=62101 RepID=A0A1D2QN57_9GAMM|nr:hypothetical protein AB835_10980 [Candidatus Endobugula sertula]